MSSQKERKKKDRIFNVHEKPISGDLLLLVSARYFFFLNECVIFNQKFIIESPSLIFYIDILNECYLSDNA